MKKLINYIKEGKGRGLKIMLIFSAIMSILSWILYRPVLTQLHTVDPQLQAVNVLWIHLGFLFGSFVSLWVLYLLVVGISALICCRLSLAKGAIWRASVLSVIGIFLVSVLLLIMRILLSLLGQVAFGLLYPISLVILPAVVVVVLVAFGICDKKAKKAEKK